MIHYHLRCSQHHEFDGWFIGSAAFEKQARLGLIECPTCGDTAVSRAMMAPAVSTRRAAAPIPAPAPQPAAGPEGPPAAAPTEAVAVRMPDHMRAMLQRLRSEVEKNCDYVGPSFADEARKMHRGESDKRGIYGETTPGEAEALADEGIEVSRIPWVPRAES
jgi:hypothetical protein